MGESQPTVIVALGSNLGDSIRLVRLAMDKVGALGGGRFRPSGLWRSSPVDCPPGSPDFINAVVAMDAPRGQSPESFLALLQAVEREFGRMPKTVLNEARPLDLDLIGWGSEVRRTPALTLPHPRAHVRRFVLAPLAQAAPEWVFPGLHRTASEILAGLPSGEEITLLDGH